jgi:hypothetical protein
LIGFLGPIVLSSKHIDTTYSERKENVCEVGGKDRAETWWRKGRQRRFQREED